MVDVTTVLARLPNTCSGPTKNARVCTPWLILELTGSTRNLLAFTSVVQKFGCSIIVANELRILTPVNVSDERRVEAKGSRRLLEIRHSEHLDLIVVTTHSKILAVGAEF